MASFYKSAAAACLVALCGLQSEATPVKTYKFSAVDVGEGKRISQAYLSVNLLRNGKLLIRISEVARDEDLVTTLKNQVVEGGALTDGTCDDMKIKSDLKEMFYRAFEYNTDTPDYRQLLQEALNAGFDAFTEEYFNGLIARQTLLKDMTAEDLNVSVEAGFAAATAVPTVLTSGLLAMLTAISA
ncbi:uncharacterized protein EMH_0058580 [Eimeria mitis]|uniref:SAG family member n=1 Tax=Eimeria mitis TaxID=44415 RepID=U6K7U8_9EIME|nr:uncharacterized protein EMH_0058580 [Eimeria mitis]CDJ34029.1 hypothetical protein EMH_0058580 [Eimeria mitis]